MSKEEEREISKANRKLTQTLIINDNNPTTAHTHTQKKRKKKKKKKKRNK
jgi:hypothetical protein